MLTKTPFQQIVAILGFAKAQNYKEQIQGTNLAVFYYGCNFDCLFCQNYEHKFLEIVKPTKIETLVKRALPERIRCICHFGCSPEPHLPFA